ncbi:hypothetical protein HZA75_04670 [Candidatus Roizmanbacteria bacterium]|nr:hypothetical protein [Candidatus Roizmanbacteria bacterium]
MKNIVILKIWRHKLPTLAALGTMAGVFLWPSIPLRGINRWLQFFYYYSPQNYFYAILSILSGIYVGIYVYDRKVQSCCSIRSKKVGAAGSVLGVLLGACPACIPVLAFFLPLSISIALSRVSLLFLILSIGIMLLSIYRMNGFRKF